MTFQPGSYYVGDPGYILPNDDLRELFAKKMNNCLKSGPQELIASRRYENGKFIFDPYWLATTPYKSGTVYDQEKNGWGFDWGCFGLVPWEWIDVNSSYKSNQIEFTEPFTCSFTEDSITIGHLHFTFNPK